MRRSTTTIENEGEGNVWVWETDTYPRGSVLAGQERRQRMECFDTMEEATKRYPKATVIDGAESAEMVRHL
ncbi:MAG: hypothetical protein V3S69_06430, partial [Dehalococcoidales bacterium]